MTAREAMITLNLIRGGGYKHLDYRRVQMACNVAIEALSKQTPVKPLDIERSYSGDCGFCPRCNKTVSDYNDVCPNCTQALDWR